MNTKPAVYCFLLDNEDRDYYILAMTLRCLERHFNSPIEFYHPWDAVILRSKPPSLVVLPNTRGDKHYFQIAKYCEEISIPVFYSESEGNYFPQSKNHYWGLNNEKRPLSGLTTVWNHTVKKKLISEKILNEDQIKVTGGAGFDRFQYLRTVDKGVFLKSINQGDKKLIITYAGWAFGKIHNKEINNILFNIGFDKTMGLDWIVRNRDVVNDMLKHAVINNPDVLFILKKHPKENFVTDTRDSPNEMNNLADFPNVFYAKSEFAIQDLIGVSDLWTAFESTSIIEAWLMNKPTLILNGVRDFNRSDIIDGCIAANNGNQFQQAIDAISSQAVGYFDNPDLFEKRKSIIEDSIGFSDGLSGYRAFKEFIAIHQPVQYIQQPKRQWIFERRKLILNVFGIFYRKNIFSRIWKLKKLVGIFENLELKVVKARYAEEKTQIDEFLDRSVADSLRK